MVDRVRIVALSVVCVNLALVCEPWLPFYSLKGRQGFTWVDFPQWESYSPDPIEACLSCPGGMVAPVAVYRAL